MKKVTDIRKEEYISISRNPWSPPEKYSRGNNVTILNNNDEVIVGNIIFINDDNFIIKYDKNLIAVYFENIKDIVNTRLLDGDDIRSR